MDPTTAESSEFWLFFEIILYISLGGYLVAFIEAGLLYSWWYLNWDAPNWSLQLVSGWFVLIIISALLTIPFTTLKP